SPASTSPPAGSRARPGARQSGIETICCPCSPPRARGCAGRRPMADDPVPRLGRRPSGGILLGKVIALPLRFRLLLLVPGVLLPGGTVGYMLTEGSDFLDALYMTVITLTTVGYGEVPSPLSPAGRWFTIALLLVGVFTFFWAAGEMIRAIVSGEMRG